MTDVLNAQWFAVYVRSRHEKSVHTALREKGLESFLPLHTQRRRWADRNKSVELPLFSNYVFCRHLPSVRVPILSTPGVIGIVGTRHQPLPISDTEIDALRVVSSSGLPCMPLPEFVVGKNVRVVDGPLAGITGVVTDVRKNSLVVGVTLLQRSVAVDIDPAWVRFVTSLEPRRIGTAA
jgi:transcription antitermination factor NusG